MAEGDNRAKFMAAIKCANSEETVWRDPFTNVIDSGGAAVSRRKRNRIASPIAHPSLETHPLGNDQTICRRDAKPVPSIGQYLLLLVLII